MMGKVYDLDEPVKACRYNPEQLALIDAFVADVKAAAEHMITKYSMSAGAWPWALDAVQNRWHHRREPRAASPFFPEGADNG